MSFDISIVIPVLNEAKTIGRLLESLAKQEGVAFEILVVDGASTDGTAGIAAACGRSLPLGIRTFTTPRGRGRQMNVGASHAAAPYLLFLHADSDFTSPVAIRDGLAALQTAGTAAGSRRAGRFGLLFGDAPNPHAGFYHYECKARLGRPGCIHGDQGFLFPAPFFHELGGFREDLPVLEDTLLAEKVRAQGSWVLLPADIVTSARRFVAEGLAARQTVNAVIMNLGFIGYWEPMEKIREMYRVQQETGGLDVTGMVREIVAMIDRLPIGVQERVWRETGRFVRDNAWQLAFFRDTRRRFRAELPPAGTPGTTLRLFDSRIAPLLAQEPAARLATVLVKIWARVLGITDRVAGVRRRPQS